MQAEEDFAGGQMQGNRANQEDFYAFSQPGDGSLLVVVADGVGGHAAGQVASKVAVQAFLEGFERAKGPETERLSTALAFANLQVAATVEADPRNFSGMGTTLVAVHVKDRALHWISVGDSPLYLFRGNELTRLNADHSAAGLPPGFKLPRNVLLSALTGSSIPLIDAPRKTLALKCSDLLLVASDGVLTLSDEEIAACCIRDKTQSAAGIAAHLLAAVVAKAKRFQDNTTVALIKIG